MFTKIQQLTAWCDCSRQRSRVESAKERYSNTLFPPPLVAWSSTGRWSQRISIAASIASFAYSAFQFHFADDGHREEEEVPLRKGMYRAFKIAPFLMGQILFKCFSMAVALYLFEWYGTIVILGLLMYQLLITWDAGEIFDILLLMFVNLCSISCTTARHTTSDIGRGKIALLRRTTWGHFVIHTVALGTGLVLLRYGMLDLGLCGIHLSGLEIFVPCLIAFGLTSAVINELYLRFSPTTLGLHQEEGSQGRNVEMD